MINIPGYAPPPGKIVVACPNPDCMGIEIVGGRQTYLFDKNNILEIRRCKWCKTQFNRNGVTLAEAGSRLEERCKREEAGFVKF